MTIYLIRHSITPGNALSRYIGITDEALSEEGVRLAQNTNYGISCKQVYVTPLRRTQETAAILFPKAEQIVVDDLREMNFGVFENRSAQEMEEDTAYRQWVDGQCLAPCPEGESHDSFSARVCAAFSALLASLEKKGEEQAVFVLHGGTIMAILEHFAEPQQPFYSYWADNCQGYRCELVKGTPFVLKNVEHIDNRA